jgi:adenylosuccinate synthase
MTDHAFICLDLYVSAEEHPELSEYVFREFDGWESRETAIKKLKALVERLEKEAD